MIRIVTDTGSDIPYLHAAEHGVEIAELGIHFEGLDYDPRTDTDFSQFYHNLTSSKGLPKTSQATPGQYLDIFNDAKEKGDEVLVVTLSGGISGTYNSAVMAQEECGYDKITVVDSRQAIITQRVLAERAVKMRDEGKSRAEIEAELVGLRDRMVVCGCLNTLEYLKKGGRIPPAMALIGTVLNMKPTIILQNSKVEPLGKARGFAAGKRLLWDQFEKTGYDESWPVWFGHTNDPPRGEEFMQETIEKYGVKQTKLYPVGGVIGTHIGPSGIILAYVKKS